MVERRKISGGLGNWLFQYAYLHSQARKGEIPDIYVQDEKYFEPYKEEIKFLYGQGVEPIDMVSLHVRRGDYVNNPFYVDLTQTDYYEKAVEQFPEDTEFLVFCADRQAGSDDEKDREWCIKWIDKNLPKRKYVFHVGKDEIDDFNTQAGCKGHITANSSFSWWSAYVSGGKTVCPSVDKWFSDGNPRISLPEEWTKI